MKTHAALVLILLAGVVLAPVPARSGTLAEALDTDDANLYFWFETRPGVWGDGENLDISLGRNGNYRSYHSSRSGRSRMTEGPGRVWIRVRRGNVHDIDLEVGGPEPRSREGTEDLGLIDAAEVREVMLSIAGNARSRDLEDAIVCAILTEGFDEFDRLLAIARDADRPSDVRESAIFWLGQEASAVSTEGLEQIVDDDDVELELREQAIFSLSQRGVDDAFEPLKRVALESRHPQLRENALFWLAQFDDPRVVDLIEEILVR